MNHQFVSKALQLTAGMLAQQHNIQLVIDENATTFSTDKQVIVMPPLAVIENRFQQAKDLETYVVGAVYHEAGHILFTDFPLRQEFRKLFWGHESYAIANSIGQIVEDVVIERAQFGNSPGAGPALLSLWSLLYQTMGVDWPEEEDVLNRAYRCIFHVARNSVLRQEWSLELAERATAWVQQVMDPVAFQAFAAELTELDLVASTAHGMKASIALLHCLGIEPVPATEGKGEPDQGDKPIFGTDSPGSDQPPPVGPDESDEGGDVFDGLIGRALKELQDTLPEGTVYATLLGPGFGFAEQSQCSDPYAGEKLRQRILSRSMFAAAKLSTLLKVPKEVATHWARSGTVVASRLWKLRSGSVKVFRKTTESEAHSTALCFLLDRSKSMEEIMGVAIEAAAFGPLAFDHVDGVKTCLSIFPGTNGFVEVLKPYEVRTAACLDAMANVKASGGTPMVEAMSQSAKGLLDASVDRRILFVVTDGAPFSISSAKAKVLELGSLGIEVIGIGIGEETKADVSSIFSDSLVIDDVSELTDGLFELLQRKLVDQRLAA